VVHAADIQDRDGAPDVLTSIRASFPWLRHVFADGGYADMLGSDAALSIPTPDHYLPLLYVLAARQSNESIRFPVEGVDGGSISMLSVQIG